MHSLENLRERIEAKLADLLPAQSPIAQPMLDAMRHAVLGGGKRMRPLLPMQVVRHLAVIWSLRW